MNTILTAGLLIVGGLYCAWHLALYRHLLRRTRYPLGPEPSVWPYISVLVPARNEEGNIPVVLDSLLAQDYPAEHMEILIGNDRSTDGTSAVARRYADRYSHIKVIEITDDLPGQRGKQNVLAQLAHHADARTVYCLVTDADIRVPPSWARTLVRGFASAQTALVSGPTVVEGTGWFGRLQAQDWRYGLGTFQAYAEAGHPITAVGNNMAFRLSHYRAIGGYEAMPFSITEDFRLYQALSRAGYDCQFPFTPTLLNRSVPIRGLRQLLHQRKRWYKGGQEAPLLARGLYYVQAMAVIGWLLAGWWVSPIAWALSLLGKGLLDSLVVIFTSRKLKLPVQWAWLPVWELYFLISLLVLPLYFILPSRVVWKGRTY